MGEQCLGALAVGLPTEDAAAGGHAYDKRAGELPVRPVAQPCRLGNDLVVARIHVVGELDLDAGPQSVRRHANGDANDAEFANRRVEAAARAVLRLQALRGAEYTTEEAHILAE